MSYFDDMPKPTKSQFRPAKERIAALPEERQERIMKDAKDIVRKARPRILTAEQKSAARVEIAERIKPVLKAMHQHDQDMIRLQALGELLARGGLSMGPTRDGIMEVRIEFEYSDDARRMFDLLEEVEQPK